MVKLVGLRSVRVRRALTQQQLAERAGLNRVTVTRLEGGSGQPYPTTVRKLADALGVEPEDLTWARAVSDSQTDAIDEGMLPEAIDMLDAPAVRRFLWEHPGLAAVVRDACEVLVRYFPDARFRLEVLEDPEYAASTQLFLGVFTDMDEDQALETLWRFDREWWVHNVKRAKGVLCIDLRG